MNRSSFLELRGRDQTIRDVRGAYLLHTVALGLVAPVLAARRLKEAEEGSPFAVGPVSTTLVGPRLFSAS